MENTRVLCVDDDRPILDSLRAFPWADYHCEWVGEATNGQQALAVLPQTQPDLLLVDIQMPIMNGLKLIPAALALLPSLRFVILTAFCDFEYARIAMRYGVQEYLVKGEYTDEDLGNTLKRLYPHDESHSAYRFEVEKCLQLMEAQLDGAVTLSGIAKQVGITPNYLGVLFRQQTGVRFRECLTQLRMKRAKELLMHTPLKIYEVAQQVGIQNPQYFATLFQETFGVLPGQLRK